MSATLLRKNIYRGTACGIGFRPYRDQTVWVLGSMFGPMLLCVDCDIEEAYDEWLTRHCQPLADDLLALADYEGSTDEERIESAMNSGELRCTNDGGFYWVDHYEWQRGFDTVAEAGRFFRQV